MSSLDLFSTSQTSFSKGKKRNDRKTHTGTDQCQNNAPLFAYQIQGKRWGVVQGCCNDWNCPRCGQQRAREEYGRIVVGAREIAKINTLYLFTVTCRGKDCTVDEAENGYLIWTNRLLTNLRTEVKRSGKVWAYASVTERQKRQHPHSHYITTYCPDDAIFVKKGEGKTYITTGDVFPAKHDTLQSYKLERACDTAGLGYQYDISRLSSVEAGSRYAAKYLFKEAIFNTVWPKGWRRVRYSNNWPKLPEIKGTAMILMKKEDWDNLAKKADVVVAKTDHIKEKCEWALSRKNVIIQ
ncbi:MAG: hypothetical protein V4490_08575 [Pseudomonadota bacterium]